MSIHAHDHAKFTQPELASVPSYPLGSEGLFNETLGLGAVMAHDDGLKIMRAMVLERGVSAQDTIVMAPIGDNGQIAQKLVDTSFGLEQEPHQTPAQKIAALGFVLADTSYQDFAVERERVTALELASARHRLASLSGDEAVQLDIYLDRTAGPELKEAITGDFEPSTGRHARKYRNWHQRLTGADDEGLMSFLRWHVDTMATQQASPEVQESIAYLKAAYRRNVTRGLQEGWLGERAERALAEIDDVPIVLGDAFSTTVSRTGGYLQSERTVVIRPGVGLTAEAQAKSASHSILEVGQHELNHRFFSFAATWRDEAYAEHVDLAMRYSDPETFDPYWRIQDETDSRIYIANRQLEAFVLAAGLVCIPPEVGIRAYSGNGADVAQYEEMVASSWNDKHVLQKLDRTVGYYEAAYAAQGLSYDNAVKSAQDLTLERFAANPAQFLRDADNIK